MRTLAKVAVVLLLATLAFAAKDFVMPPAKPAVTYPAHDGHQDEHVAIAADPYDTPAKAAIFRTKFAEHGYMPVFFVITNDSGKALNLTNMKIQLVTEERTKIQPADEDDLYRRIGRLKRRGDETNPLPIPLPRRGAEAGVKKETREEIQSALFRNMAVDPRKTKGGFLFFDVQGIREPLAGAHLYITGVRDSDGNDLMFFEISLDKYLGK